MPSVREFTQGVVAIGSMACTFLLIGLGKLDPDTGLSLMFALLGGLGIGYANGKASNNAKG